MPRKWPRHFIVKPSGFYFQATSAMKRAGIALSGGAQRPGLADRLLARLLRAQRVQPCFQAVDRCVAV